ncbi:MAG: MmcQ/YjbR family DNA-binding protein [Clostridia bacterium]|nr:MmcQ/YjbR family DNA-binding protein [Clostridia bacterium]
MVQPSAPQRTEVVRLIESRFGVHPQHPWARTPDYAVFRHPPQQRWFAVLMPELPGRVIGHPAGERVDLLNLKADPRMIGSLIDHRHFFPAYHMNKEHWYSVWLDGSLGADTLLPLLEISHRLTAPSLPKSPKSQNPANADL